jgi:ribosomal protein S18 acetylase RimI-like enzyme
VRAIAVRLDRRRSSRSADLPSVHPRVGWLIGVVTDISLVPARFEIWNIALAEGYRGRGLGRAAIGAIADRCRRDGASRLTVGTSDCSLGTIAFYRKAGFRFAGVRQGYFDTYPVAVVENGIRARDMVMFQMPLTPSSMSNPEGNH